MGLMGELIFKTLAHSKSCRSYSALLFHIYTSWHASKWSYHTVLWIRLLNLLWLMLHLRLMISCGEADAMEKWNFAKISCIDSPMISFFYHIASKMYQLKKKGLWVKNSFLLLFKIIFLLISLWRNPGQPHFKAFMKTSLQKEKSHNNKNWAKQET